MKRFGETPVSITLLVEEWFALVTRLSGRELSPKGSRIYREATLKIVARLNETIDKRNESAGSETAAQITD